MSDRVSHNRRNRRNSYYDRDDRDDRGKVENQKDRHYSPFGWTFGLFSGAIAATSIPVLIIGFVVICAVIFMMLMCAGLVYIAVQSPDPIDPNAQNQNINVPVNQKVGDAERVPSPKDRSKEPIPK